MLPENKAGMKDELAASPREPLALVFMPRTSQSPSSGARPVHSPHSAQPLHALVEQLSRAHIRAGLLRGMWSSTRTVEHGFSQTREFSKTEILMQKSLGSLYRPLVERVP